MKIATFNINDVNKRLTNLLLWLASSKPDVACLQELKATDRAFPADALLNAGYCAVWKGERTWNGVAILSPYRAMTTMPRPGYIEAAVNGVIIASIYLPNGNPQPGPKFKYKLD